MDIYLFFKMLLKQDFVRHLHRYKPDWKRTYGTIELWSICIDWDCNRSMAM